MKTLKINFENDLKKLLLDSLKKAGYQFNSNKCLNEIVRDYYNVSFREISITPRKVHISDELKKRVLPDNIKKGFENIISKVESGKNLNPHLSTDLLKPDYKDPLLYDWKIHHLHLGIVKDVKKAKFVSRTNELLYARIEDNDFYCIDILDHHEEDGFANKQLIEIIHYNWPKLLERYRLVGVLPPSSSEELGNNQINQLRKAGISTLICTADKTVYAPPGYGQATDGSSLLVTMNTIKLMQKLRDMEKVIIDNEDCIRNKIQKDIRECPEKLEIKLKSWDESGIFTIEKRMNIEIKFPWGTSSLN